MFDSPIDEHPLTVKKLDKVSVYPVTQQKLSEGDGP